MTEREEKQLERICEKLEYMKSKQKEILSREKKLQRKEKTRRLIQNGALAEKYLYCEGLPPQEFEKVLKSLSEIQGFKENIEYIIKSLPL